MPSCVVKCCRNNSTYQKKGQGITFHRFPKEQLWRSDWCSVIQKCRGDDNWMPSKTSVLLFEPQNFQEKPVLPIMQVKLEPNIQEYQDSLAIQVKPEPNIQVKEEPNLQVKQEPNTQVEQELNIIVNQEANMQVEQDPLNMPVKQEPQYIEEQRAESNTSDASLRKVCHHELLSTSFEPRLPRPSSPARQTSPTIDAAATGSEQPPSLELEIGSSKFFSCSKCGHINNHSHLINKPNFLPQTQAGMEKDDTNIESFDTPRDRCFKEILKEKNIRIEDQKKKIKTLNQRIRRLQYRNKSIKDKLRNLKKLELR